MATHYADTLAEISRIQRHRLPITPVPLLKGAMVSRAWVNDPIHDHVAPMEDHVIAPTLRGDGFSEVRFGAKTISSRSVTGGITIAPRGFGGRFDCDGRPLASNVFLDRHRLQRCTDELQTGRSPELVPRLNFDDGKLFLILKLISAEAESPGLHEHLYIEQLIDLLCLQLLRTHCANPLVERRRIGGLAPWQVRCVESFMQDRLEDRIELQDLADLVHLSRFHFCTAFRKATGQTPYQRLVRIRMDRARQLLASSRLSVTEVALAVGFETPSAFAQAFRSCFAMTPREFRRLVRDA